MRPPRGIRIGDAGKKGRGVFATKHFLPDDLIERAPIIVIDTEDEVEAIEETRIADYWYEYDADGDAAAVGLGYTSLYNHSRRPNAKYSVREDAPIIEIVAIREIKLGTEITINYNGDPKNTSSYPFEAATKGAQSRDLHYLLHGGWGDEGWVWCGENDVFNTSIPNLVTCKECIRWMHAAKNDLDNWKPPVGVRKLTKSGAIASLRWLADELKDHDRPGDVHLLMDLAKLLRRIPASEFPGGKSGKK